MGGDAVDLDAPERFAAVDPADALGDVEATAAQWATAAEIATVRLDLDHTDAVVVTGMGGSGICGDVVWALGLDTYPLPIVVHKGYGLPGFVGRRTLVLAVSYSGATEETRSAFAEAARRGARRFAVASGGPLTADCGGDDVPCIVVPAGRQPRHSLGYLLVPALVALGLDVGLDEAVDVLGRLAEQLGRSVATDENPAKRLALQLAGGGVPLILGGRGAGAVAGYRLKCQLNENAKLPAIAGELPEADHNEVVGWEHAAPTAPGRGLVALRDPQGEPPRVHQRFAVTADLLADRLAWRVNLVACGETPLARMASLLLQADLVSVYTALALGRDPTPVAAIDRLKAALA